VEPIRIDPQTEQMIADVVRSFTDYGLNVVGAIALLVIGWTAANWAQRLVARGLSRLPWMDQTVKPFISRVVWWIIVIFVLARRQSRNGSRRHEACSVLWNPSPYAWRKPPLPIQSGDWLGSERPRLV